MKTAVSENDSSLVWLRNTEPDLLGYRIVWRTGSVRSCRQHHGIHRQGSVEGSFLLRRAGRRWQCRFGGLSGAVTLKRRIFQTAGGANTFFGVPAAKSTTFWNAALK